METYLFFTFFWFKSSKSLWEGGNCIGIRALPQSKMYLTVAKVCNLIFLFRTFRDSLPRRTRCYQSTKCFFFKCLDPIKTCGLRTNVSQRDFNASDHLVPNPKTFCRFRKSSRLAKQRRFSSENYQFVSLLQD